jgi:hypothetical protein
LDFEETPFDKPVDPMTAILNKQEIDNVTDEAHLNVGKVISTKNEGKLRSAMDAFKKFFEDILNGTEDTTVTPTAKMNAMAVSTAISSKPDKESLEGQIELVRQALTDKLGLKYPDGTKRTVWSVMTLPDNVIWQNPDTMQYYSTPYTLTGEDVTFDDAIEVEQAYVVKQANTVFMNMTTEDIQNITRRNKMADPIVEDPKVKELSDANAKLQKELEDSKAALKVLEDAKVQAQKEQFDAKWAGLKATVIPPGEIKDPENEAKLQKMSTEDPLGFAEKVAGWKNAPKKEEEGSAHTQGPGAEDHNAKLNRILAESSPAIPGRLH